VAVLVVTVPAIAFFVHPLVPFVKGAYPFLVGTGFPYHLEAEF
jgi:hypothetical protein